MSRKRKTTDALRMLDNLVGDDPERRLEIEQEFLNSKIAKIIHDARKRANLSQAQLARRVGTTQSAISRIENADYGGNRTLPLFVRILHALDARAHLEINPAGKNLIEA